MVLIDFFGKNSDEKLINFSLRKVRAQAWIFAKLLWSIAHDNLDQSIKSIKAFVCDLSQMIKKPRMVVLRMLLPLVKLFESKNPGKIILRLKNA